MAHLSKESLHIAKIHMHLGQGLPLHFKVVMVMLVEAIFLALIGVEFRVGQVFHPFLQLQEHLKHIFHYQSRNAVIYKHDIISIFLGVIAILALFTSMHGYVIIPFLLLIIGMIVGVRYLRYSINFRINKYREIGSSMRKLINLPSKNSEEERLEKYIHNDEEKEDK